jgi:hypothetical protein
LERLAPCVALHPEPRRMFAVAHARAPFEREVLPIRVEGKRTARLRLPPGTTPTMRPGARPVA